MTPGSRGAAASGLALPCLLAAALLALSAGCSSDQHAEAATTASSTHTTDPSDTTETTTKASADSGAGDGIIAGEPFTAGTQLVQWDALSNAWRLHILSGEHSCAEDLGGLRPSVGIDFQGPTESAVTVPPAGTFTEGVGVVFRPADPDASFGPLTTTTGVTLGLELTISQPGEHWKGRLSVDGFQPDGTAYGFDGPIDAEVCEPVTG